MGRPLACPCACLRPGSAPSLQSSAWRAAPGAAGKERCGALNEPPGPAHAALTARCPSVQVCSINSRFAKVNILYVGSTPLKSTFRGTIRREDIRATEKDKVEVYKSFRPGDIVLAKVISLGDAQSNYLLSTAENELGVVVARSEAGVQMVPISWCEMQCPQTHTKDFRKVARVQPQFLQT